ncbi:tryptophan 2,3-dioxygenase [Deinococcus radiopugnans]|uniref:Tryptophan 2,3-dioxygenase n=1 Tax=Deinococcus radiopugnans ATCC 19172 TaxID=585398 RepID=A0A5C4YB41_9DEIO|nr:tryptophan 2,3-dioxygenase family protein [Deinococcus radiopugnans]MBB6015284.1 tryptophan 2,3-dioxygenase [Deinococcus radiopugnans ATCC 19172]QLG13153.1 tryptophan 2,3-dioxygenase [Deinococcus sp. D7000]TNM73018.1 tryptophan 2,3-dioxygenase [Deinococcus radiopugnans ATCC 19172]
MTGGDQNAAERAYTDFSQSLSYGDYLRLDTLKAAHQPITGAHDEHLFITVHHVSEVWLELIVRELRAAMTLLEGGITDAPLKMLTRVVRAQEQLTNAWEVLKTMTPADYLQFRHAFGQASGFQSASYRTVEFLLGNRRAVLLRPHEHRPDLHGPLEAVLHAPSVYDLALRLLAERGLPVPDEVLGRDLTQPPVLNETVLESWLTVYRDPETYWDLYELAEKLLDVEDNFRRWRFNHLTTVERTIGFKPGSGGTSGAGYLRGVLSVVLFPELWEVRTRL